MPDYKKLYFTLFNALTDVVEAINCGHTEEAEKILTSAQIKAEEQYIEMDE